MLKYFLNSKIISVCLMICQRSVAPLPKWQAVWPLWGHPWTLWPWWSEGPALISASWDFNHSPWKPFEPQNAEWDTRGSRLKRCLLYECWIVIGICNMDESILFISAPHSLQECYSKAAGKCALQLLSTRLKGVAIPLQLDTDTWHRHPTFSLQIYIYI